MRRPMSWTGGKPTAAEPKRVLLPINSRSDVGWNQMGA
jgi:hypothetical protein